MNAMFNDSTTMAAAADLPYYEESWFYVVTGLAITVVFQLLCFVVAAACKFDLITDFAGSTNFMLLALLSLCLTGAYSSRQVAVTVLVVAARLELAIFLLVRVIVRKKDARFDKTRDNCVRFFIFWVFQMFWVWVCTLPVVFINSRQGGGDVGGAQAPPLGAADYIAWAMMVFGFVFQVIADVHKYRFKLDPANKDAVCNTGLWATSRHPNYFGEMVFWWGAWVATIPLFLSTTSNGGVVGSVADNTAWAATVVSPLFTMLILLGGSGVPTAEGKNLARFYENPRKRDEYARYHRRTPPVIPCCCPAAYEALPMRCKCLVCCEFPCYQYKGSGDAEAEGLEGKMLGKSATGGAGATAVFGGDSNSSVVAPERQLLEGDVESGKVQVFVAASVPQEAE